MASDMFIKVGDIKGESVDSAHKDEIDILSWSWGMSQSGTMHRGGGGGGGKANVQDLTFTKWVDKATPNLMLFCCTGKHYPQAVLTLRKAGDKPVEYLIITMTDVLITSVTTGGAGGEDALTEQVSLTFSKVKTAYQPQKKDGSKDGGPVEMMFDIEANK